MGSGGTMMDLLAVEFSICRCLLHWYSFKFCVLLSVHAFFLGAAILKSLFRIECNLDDLISEISYHLNCSEFICSLVQFISDLVCSVYFFKHDCKLPL